MFVQRFLYLEAFFDFFGAKVGKSFLRDEKKQKQNHQKENAVLPKYNSISLKQNATLSPQNRKTQYFLAHFYRKTQYFCTHFCRKTQLER